MKNLKIYRIPKVSKKQARKNREIAKLKANMYPICFCKGCRNNSIDPAHLLPRSTFPEYYTEEWNIVGMCRGCHNRYDNDIEFRKKQTHIIEIVKQHDELAANRYFKL